MRRVKPAKNLENARFRLLKRRIQRHMPRHPGRVFGAGLAFLALAGGVVGLADLFDHGSRLGGAMLATSAGLGLTVQDIAVEGRDVTAAEDILKALGAGRGTPILGVGPAAAKQRLESLPWIKIASVERRLPDTLYVKLTERTPLALWQRHGKTVLIDHDGTVVATEHLDRYGDLLLIVGEDAPAHGEELLDVLKTQPALMKHVASAMRVGARRWTLRLDSGVDIELPETNFADAWTRLAAIDHQHGLLARDIESVDLRLSDRVVVKPSPEPAKPGPAVKRAKAVAKST